LNISYKKYNIQKNTNSTNAKLNKANV